MNVTDPLVLRSDVVLLPVSDLEPEVREKFESDEGDYTISRRHGRMGSQVIDSETAALLQLFRKPRTIVEAVIENSRALQKDPEQWLEELLPHLGTFLQNSVLVPAGSEEEKEMRQLVENGARVGEWEVLRCINLIEDSEVYRVRRGETSGALKIARQPGAVAQWFATEEQALRHLDGRVAPKLLDSGAHQERTYLVVEWFEGVEAGIAATQSRHDRLGKLEVCVAIATAYADLHDCGVLHGDVHMRNVLVDAQRRARLIDFGVARIDDGNPAAYASRAGMFYFFEPEYIAGMSQGLSIAASHRGEQHAVAAMLYLVITGVHYLDFRYERAEMMRQIVEETPIPFEQRGLPPWPEIEAILFRALAKDPAKRYESMREFADTLRAALEREREASLSAALEPHALTFFDEELAAVARGGEVFEQGFAAPRASINMGTTGVSFGLLQIASIRSDAKLFALAELWATRGMLFVGREDGWLDEENDMPHSIVGDITPYHTVSGLFATRAFLSHARGDTTSQLQWIHAYVQAAQRPCEQIDLTLGRLGTLHGATLLLELSDKLPAEELATLREFGNHTMSEVWAKLEAMPPIAQNPGAYLGIAHGWSGFLYAILRWCLASGTPIPESFEHRLRELATMRFRRGERGSAWLRQVGGQPGDLMAGWCNGAAGHVFLWTLAHDVFRKDEYLQVATEAVWNAWEEGLYTADLCCGSAGRAYALLNFYKHTGDREWLGRARQLANHAARAVRESAQRAHSLWKGDFGVAVLIADLEAPESARMPFFE